MESELSNIIIRSNCAILISGCARNAFSTIDSFIENVVISNNADVFVLLRKNSEYDCEHEKNNGGNIESLLKTKLGNRLKLFLETTAEYEIYYKNAILNASKNLASHGDISKNKHGSMFHYDVNTKQMNHGIIDQYTMLSFLANKFTQYEEAHNKAYRYIIKTRIDRMNFVDTFNIECSMKNENDMLVFGGAVGWLVDCFFFGTHELMVKLCRDFYLDLFLHKDDNFPETYQIFSPEKQICYTIDNIIKESQNAKLHICPLPKNITIAKKSICSKCHIYNIFFK